MIVMKTLSKLKTINNIIYVKETEMINSNFIGNPSKATRREFHEAIEQALYRAKEYHRNVGVFENRKGELFVQNIQPNSLQYFGREGILYSTQI